MEKIKDTDVEKSVQGFVLLCSPAPVDLASVISPDTLVPAACSCCWSHHSPISGPLLFSSCKVVCSNTALGGEGVVRRNSTDIPFQAALFGALEQSNVHGLS